MADEQPDPSEIPESIIIDTEHLDDIRVVFSLDKLGELIAHVAWQLTSQRGLEPPDLQGEEMRSLAIGGWKHCLHMADRENFIASVGSDLARLEENPFAPLPAKEPEHLPEFGAPRPPLGWNPPV